MSEPRDADVHGVYTMPSSSFRVEDGPAFAEPTPAQEPHPRRTEPSAPAASAPRRHRLWDIALSAVLLVGGAGAAAFGSMMALFLAFAADACGPDCNFTQMDIGMWTAMFAPWVAWLIGVVVVIVRLRKKRLAFWVPFAGAALGVIGWLLGAWIVGSAVG